MSASNDKARMALRKCEVLAQGAGQQISITMQAGDDEFEKEHQCQPESDLQLLAAVAQTTLDAMLPALNRPITFKLVDLQFYELGEPPQTFITTLITVDFGKSQLSLPGICTVGESRFETAAKSAL